MTRSEDARPRRRGELTSVSRLTLQSEPWVSPHHGFHRDAMLSDPVRQRILDASAVMPGDAVLGGWAAAYLHGVTYLDGADQPVQLVIPPTRVVNRPGITTLRTLLSPDEMTTRHGIACTTGVRTGYDLLRQAPNLTEAVVAADCLLHAGVADLAGLAAFAEAHPGRRGLRQLAAALPLLDPATASPPESRLRLLCRFDAGLPSLLVNVPVFDLAGTFLGIPDLLEPVAGLVVEYDGAHHRELEQHTADNAREERLENAGLTVARVTALDLADRAATAGRIALAHRRGLVRDRSGDRWVVQQRRAA